MYVASENYSLIKLSFNDKTEDISSVLFAMVLIYSHFFFLK